MNVNGTGAENIYWGDSSIGNGTVTVGVPSLFVFSNGIYYYLGITRVNSLTFNTSGWELQSSGYYKNGIYYRGVRGDDVPIADIYLGSDPDANAEYLEAWSLVERITTNDDYVYLYAREAPTVNIQIQIRLVR